MRRTKIIATVGPASADGEVLKRLVEEGVDVFRLNYSHGTHESHEDVLTRIREVAGRAGREVGVLQDLSGPKIRTGDVEGGGAIALETGSRVLLVPEAGPLKPGILTSTLPSLVDDLEPGQRVLLSDGRLELLVEECRPEGARLNVVRGGHVSGRSGINLPTTAISVPSLTEKDRADLRHGLAAGVDMVALSFVRRPEDLDDARRAAADSGREIFLVAKIEKQEAVHDLDAILDGADAVMVARGDLGVELAAEEVPLLQKRIIRAANERRLPVITATQMLESMVLSPVPTRAEASDVANAILDGTDAVMLSAETATGRFPVETVRTMVRIAQQADIPETSRNRPRIPEEGALPPPEAVARAAAQAAEDVQARAVVVYTESGSTARLLASWRPRVPVLALSPELETVRRLQLSIGERTLIDAGQVQPGDRVVVVSGSRAANPGGTNMLKIHTVGEMD